MVLYTFSHNHGSVKWLYLKGNYYWRDPFFTSMITGGRVIVRGDTRSRDCNFLGSEASVPIRQNSSIKTRS